MISQRPSFFLQGHASALQGVLPLRTFPALFLAIHLNEKKKSIDCIVHQEVEGYLYVFTYVESDQTKQNIAMLLYND